MSVASSSSSSSSRSISPVSPSETNSVMLTQIPIELFHPDLMKVLHDHFQLFGEINQWVPITSFRRVIIVYERPESAEQAKLECDPLILPGFHIHNSSEEIKLRVYRSTPNPLISSAGDAHEIDENAYLKPPTSDKNFLISPPGSPPEGWEPIVEDPPNRAPLAEDLMEALRKLQLRNPDVDQGKKMVMEPEDGVGICVYVEFEGSEDLDAAREDEWIYGQPSPARNRWKPIPAAMPPVQS